MGDDIPRNGMRFRRHLLAMAAWLAWSRCLEKASSDVTGTPARSWTTGLGSCLHGQCLYQGKKRGSAIGPTPTDRGRTGTKRHLLTDRKGTPLAVVLSGANMHDSVPLSVLLDAATPVAGRLGLLASDRVSCTPTRHTTLLVVAVPAVGAIFRLVYPDVVWKILSDWDAIAGWLKKPSLGWNRCVDSQHDMSGVLISTMHSL